MSFLILVDNTFNNKFNAEFEDIFINKINLLKEKLNCDIKNIDHNDDIKDLSIEQYLNNIYIATENYENIIYVPSTMIMINVEDTIKLSIQHRDNISYFSYGENYPNGMIPFIIRRDAFEKLFNIIKNKNIETIDEDTIKNIVFIDPNFFEIEIIISQYDLRYYRLNFFANSKRNNILIKNFIEYDNYDNIAKQIKENPKLRRTIPSYIELDITNRQNVINKSLSFILEEENSKKEKYINLQDFKEIYNKIINFSEDFHISIGAHYEPLLNDDIFDILSFATENSNVKVYLETNALLLSEDKVKKLLSIQDKRNNLYTIIHLDAVDENIFKSIYKDNDNLKTILSNIDYYLIREPKNTYIQITKQTDNFEHLKDFYKYFEKYQNINIIMQKYYTYRNIVENKKIGDMTPLINVGCWHLARDLFIDSYGDVYICRFDIKKEKRIASIYNENIESIWYNLEKYYIQNVSKEIEFCNNCDEWYLYNF